MHRCKQKHTHARTHRCEGTHTCASTDTCTRSGHAQAHLEKKHTYANTHNHSTQTHNYTCGMEFTTVCVNVSTFVCRYCRSPALRRTQQGNYTRMLLCTSLNY